MKIKNIIISAISALCLTLAPFAANAADAFTVKTDVFNNSVILEAEFSRYKNTPVSIQIIPQDFDVSTLSDTTDPSTAEAAKANVTYFNQLTSDSSGNISLTGQLVTVSGTYTIRLLPINLIGTALEKDFEFVTYTDAQTYWDALVGSPAANLSPLLTALNVTDELVLSMTSEPLLHDKISDYGSIGAFTKPNADALLERIKNDCNDVKLIKKVLSSIKNVGNNSQIAAIITNAENARVLGITSYVSRYNALSSTDSVDTAIAGKTFASPASLRATFIPALELAEQAPVAPVIPPRDNTPVGGGTIGGTVSSPVQTPVIDANASAGGLPFADIDSVPWAQEAITSLYSQGIINGKSAETFAPNDYILREEFVKLVVAMTKAELSAEDCPFTDADAGAWYTPYVTAAYRDGIAKGRDDGTFGVGEYISRQDVAVMLSRLIADSEADNDNKFYDDADISDYAKQSVYSLSAKGVINGSDGSFMPKSYATRAETACMIYRMTNLLKEGN